MKRIPLLTGSFWLALWESALFRGVLLVAITLVAYIPATHCRYIWDDDVYVTDNPLLSAPDGLRRIWFSFDSPSQYFPLVYTTFRLEYALWGLDPLGYHCVNILLHASNALLLWRLLSRLRIPGAWFAAALFAVHPVQVESVAWVTELKNVLMGFFFLLALLAWTEFHKSRNARAWWFYGLSLALYALALFSKTTACTFPVALLVILWLRDEKIGVRRLLEILPYALLGVGMGLLTVWWERYHQGTQGKGFTMGIPQRLMIVGRNVWFYLDKLAWPAKLTFSYPRWTFSPAHPLGWFWMLALCAVAAWLYLARRRIGRGAFAALVFFVATLGPILGVLMLYTYRYTFVADHYQYLACIGPIALVSAGADRLAHRSALANRTVYILGPLILLTLTGLTWKQCGAYFNDETVWVDVLHKNPGSLMAHYNLGNEMMRDGQLPLSLAEYNKAVEIDPSFVDARCNRADLLASMGRLPEAVADYQQAAQLDPGNALVQDGYGTVLEKMGKPDQAASHFSQAIQLEPHYPLAEKNLADLLAGQGNYAAALQHYEAVESMLPDAPQAHMTVAQLDVRTGRFADAIREYRQVTRLAPRSPVAFAELASLLAQCSDPALRDPSQAVAFARQACELTHSQTAAYLNILAIAYAADNCLPDAIAAAQSAVKAATKAGDKRATAYSQAQLKFYQKTAAGTHP